jgi:hypothetical protein
MKKEAEGKDENLTEEDAAKNCKWTVLGGKGTRRLIKQSRESDERRKKPERIEVSETKEPEAESADRNRRIHGIRGVRVGGKIWKQTKKTGE